MDDPVNLTVTERRN